MRNLFQKNKQHLLSYNIKNSFDVKRMACCTLILFAFSCSKQSEEINSEIETEKGLSGTDKDIYMYVDMLSKLQDSTGKNGIVVLSIKKEGDKISATYEQKEIALTVRNQEAISSIKPGESTTCRSTRCIVLEAKECFDSGGTLTMSRSGGSYSMSCSASKKEYKMQVLDLDVSRYE